MGSKAQISIFLIIGIVIVLVASIFYLGNRYTPTRGIYNILGVSNAKVYFEQYMTICVENAAKDAISQYGIVNSQQELVDSVELQVRQCIHNEEVQDQGYTITEVSLPSVIVFMDDAMIDVHVDYPLEFENAESSFSITTIDYTIRREMGLDLVKNRVTPFITGMAIDPILPRKLFLESGDSKAILRIPIELKPIGYTYVYLRMAGEVQQDPTVISYIAYDITPFAIRFENTDTLQAQLSISYNERDIPTEVREEDLTLMRFDFQADAWVEVSSTVDAQANSVLGTIDQGGRYSIGFKDPCGKPKASRKGQFECTCAGGTVACWVAESCQDLTGEQTSWCNLEEEDQLHSVCGRELGSYLDQECAMNEEPGVCAVCEVFDGEIETRTMGTCTNTDYSSDVRAELGTKGYCTINERIIGEDCVEIAEDRYYIREFYCYKELQRPETDQYVCGSTLYNYDEYGLIFNVEDYSVCGEICFNGLDDNEDGLLDCLDPACQTKCRESSVEPSDVTITPGSEQEFAALYPMPGFLSRVYFAIAPPNYEDSPSGDIEEPNCKGFEDTLKEYVGIIGYVTADGMIFKVAADEDDGNCPWDNDNSLDGSNLPGTAKLISASTSTLVERTQVEYTIRFEDGFPLGTYNIYTMYVNKDETGECESGPCWIKQGSAVIAQTDDSDDGETQV